MTLILYTFSRFRMAVHRPSDTNKKYGKSKPSDINNEENQYGSTFYKSPKKLTKKVIRVE